MDEVSKLKKEASVAAADATAARTAADHTREGSSNLGDRLSAAEACCRALRNERDASSARLAARTGDSENRAAAFEREAMELRASLAGEARRPSGDLARWC